MVLSSAPAGGIVSTALSLLVATDVTAGSGAPEVDAELEPEAEVLPSWVTALLDAAFDVSVA